MEIFLKVLGTTDGGPALISDGADFILRIKQCSNCTAIMLLMLLTAHVDIQNGVKI